MYTTTGDMVRSKLKLLIQERNIERMRRGKKTLTTRQIADLAGIAHSTLTGLTANRMKGVQFDTLQALCRFFNCTPGDILEYRPENEDFRPGPPMDHMPPSEDIAAHVRGFAAAQAGVDYVQRKLLQDPWLEAE